MTEKCAACGRSLTKEERKQNMEQKLCYFCYVSKYEEMVGAGALPEGKAPPPELFGRKNEPPSIVEQAGIAERFKENISSTKKTDAVPQGLIDPTKYKPTRIRFNFNNQDDTYAEIQVPIPLHPEIKDHVEHFLRAVVLYAQQMSTMATLDIKSLAMLEDFMSQRSSAGE